RLVSRLNHVDVDERDGPAQRLDARLGEDRAPGDGGAQVVDAHVDGGRRELEVDEEGRAPGEVDERGEDAAVHGGDERVAHEVGVGRDAQHGATRLRLHGLDAQPGVEGRVADEAV